MTLTSIIVLILAIFLCFVLSGIASKPSTIEMQTAFAGIPQPQVPSKVMCNQPNRKVNTLLGEEKVDLSGFEKILIKGHSLEKAGIMDNSIVYVTKYNMPPENMDFAVGRFIILKIDNERTSAEHPLDPNYVHSMGLKARKVIRIVPTNLDEEGLKSVIGDIFDQLPAERKEILKQQILEKYMFASNYYAERGESTLIMSLTYRNDGRDLGFSFHSKQFLYGIIEYVNNNPSIKESRSTLRNL